MFIRKKRLFHETKNVYLQRNNQTKISQHSLFQLKKNPQRTIKIKTQFTSYKKQTAQRLFWLFII